MCLLFNRQDEGSSNPAATVVIHLIERQQMSKCDSRQLRHVTYFSTVYISFFSTLVPSCGAGHHNPANATFGSASYSETASAGVRATNCQEWLSNSGSESHISSIAIVCALTFQVREHPFTRPKWGLAAVYWLPATLLFSSGDGSTNIKHSTVIHSEVEVLERESNIL
jgi:hypothetical protein